MADPKLPLHFEKCPWCGEKKTLSDIAIDKPPGAIGGIKFAKIPIVAGTRVATPMIPHLFLTFDYCAGCGRERLIYVEKKIAPIGVQAQGLGGG